MGGNIPFIDLYRVRCGEKNVIIQDSLNLPSKYCKFCEWLEFDLNHNKQQWLTSNASQDHHGIIVLGK